MQDMTDAGQDSCRKGRLHERTDAGHVRCRTGRMQGRSDVGPVKCSTGQMEKMTTFTFSSWSILVRISRRIISFFGTGIEWVKQYSDGDP